MMELLVMIDIGLDPSVDHILRLLYVSLQHSDSHSAVCCYPEEDALDDIQTLLTIHHSSFSKNT